MNYFSVCSDELQFTKEIRAFPPKKHKAYLPVPLCLTHPEYNILALRKRAALDSQPLPVVNLRPLLSLLKFVPAFSTLFPFIIYLQFFWL